MTKRIFGLVAIAMTLAPAALAASLRAAEMFNRTAADVEVISYLDLLGAAP